MAVSLGMGELEIKRRSMIVIVRLMGGLGNQLFQYAAGRAIAHRNQMQLKLDVSVSERDAQRPPPPQHRGG